MSTETPSGPTAVFNQVAPPPKILKQANTNTRRSGDTYSLIRLIKSERRSIEIPTALTTKNSERDRPPSLDEVGENVTMHISQSTGNTVVSHRQLGVINSQLMQDGRMNVVNLSRMGSVERLVTPRV